MIINANSWHVKLHDVIFDKQSRPQNLCPYFWKVVAALFLATLLFSSLLTGFTLIGQPLAAWLFAHVGVLSDFVTYPVGTFIGAICISSIFAFAFGVCYGYTIITEYIKNRMWDRRYEKERAKLSPDYVEPTPNLIVGFIRSRKEKFCPKLEFKDVEK
jgi:hypothetical protein